MAYCEDFPACGHEPGCCPDRDRYGRVVGMRCTCGAPVPITSRWSLCRGCIARMFRDDGSEADPDD